MSMELVYFLVCVTMLFSVVFFAWLNRNKLRKSRKQLETIVKALNSQEKP